MTARPALAGDPRIEATTGADSARRDLDAVAAYFRHDFLAPVRTVQLGIDLVFDDDLDDADRDALRGHVRDAAAQLAHVASRLRDHFTLDLGPTQPVGLAEVVAAAASRAEDQLGADLGPGLDDALPVLGDPALITTLFVELIDNAHRHGGGRPVIDAQSACDGVEVHVHDDGVGFGRGTDPRSMIELMRRSPEGGVGVGLATCRRIMELHDGQMWIDSDVTDGTTVHLVFP